MTDIIILSEYNMPLVSGVAESFGLSPKRIGREGITELTYREFEEPKRIVAGEVVYSTRYWPVGFWARVQERMAQAAKELEDDSSNRN